ncbi:unnamed protein product [Knipowitschia caucasica]
MSHLGSASLEVNPEKRTIRAEVKDVVVTDFAMGCAATAAVAYAASAFFGGQQQQSNKK